MRWREELTRRFPRLTAVPPGAYVVGGALRDLLAGREPADVDVATLDPLTAARAIRDRVIRLGDEEHLSAYRVVDGGHVYDFAALLDGSIDSDLGRRDFTVNAMAVDLRDGTLLDPYAGAADVAAGVVRMVDAANFDDDPLRVLKGVRMAVKYGMRIEDTTLEAMRLRAPRITEMAAERVVYELSVIFSSNAFRDAVDLLARAGLAAPLGLSAPRVHADEVSLAASLAVLVADPRAHAARWRWSAALLHEVLTLQRLAKSHDRLALYDAGESIARQLPAMLRALGRDEPLDMPDFAIRALLTGEEIAALTGLAPGKELGTLKRQLLEAQVMGRVGARAEAEEFVRTFRPAESRPSP